MRRIVATLTLLALLALAAGAHAYPTGSENQDIWSVANQELLFNAEHCVKDTHVFLYRVSSGCNGGKNEEWTFKKLPAPEEHDVIYADYGSSGDECLNVANSEYKDWTDIYAWQCNPSAPTPNEEFRQPENTESSRGGGDWIVPARQPIPDQYCLNVERGVREEARIILWTCNNQENEDFWFG